MVRRLRVERRLEGGRELTDVEDLHSGPNVNLCREVVLVSGELRENEATRLRVSRCDEKAKRAIGSEGRLKGGELRRRGTHSSVKSLSLEEPAEVEGLRGREQRCVRLRSLQRRKGEQDRVRARSTGRRSSSEN
jgi:hypothetical protein